MEPGGGLGAVPPLRARVPRALHRRRPRPEPLLPPLQDQPRSRLTHSRPVKKGLRENGPGLVKNTHAPLDGQSFSQPSAG